jgi:hypothetical protein
MPIKRLDRAWQAPMTRIEAFKNDAPPNALLKGLMGKQAEHLLCDVWFSEAEHALRLRWCPQ